MSSPSRAPLIASAVQFLRDPSTSSSPLAKRIAYLESRGLTPQEIEQAITAASSGAGPVGYGQGPYPTTRRGGPEFDRDWRDWFIMAVVGGGVGWVAVKLAQKFLLPHLQPPDETDLAAAQKALEAKYDEAAELLKHLQTSTDALTSSLDEQKATVEADLVEVRKAVAEMREGERKREEWAKSVGEQVDEVVKSLPGMLEKQATAQAQSLTDLQTELKSLKSLLIARRPASGPLPPSSGGPNYADPSAASSSPPTRASSFTPRTPGIPSWQLKANPAPAPVPAVPAPTSIGGGMYSTAPNAVLTPTAPVVGASEVEDTSASGILVEKEDGTPVAEVEKEKESEAVGVIRSSRSFKPIFMQSILHRHASCITGVVLQNSGALSTLAAPYTLSLLPSLPALRSLTLYASAAKELFGGGETPPSEDHRIQLASLRKGTREVTSLSLVGFATSAVGRFLAVFQAIHRLSLLALSTPGQPRADLSEFLPVVGSLRQLDDLTMAFWEEESEDSLSYEQPALCSDPPPVRRLTLHYPNTRPSSLDLVSLFSQTLEELNFTFNADVDEPSSSHPLVIPNLTNLAITHTGSDQKDACDLLRSVLASPYPPSSSGAGTSTCPEMADPSCSSRISFRRFNASKYPASAAGS